MSVRLLVLEGRHRGRYFKLPPTQFVIGRDPRCHLRPASSDVSRFHCAIAVSSGIVHVRDLRSCNGTFVNERRIKGSMRVAQGDVLQVGPLRFEFQIDAQPLVVPSDSEFRWLIRTPEPEESRVLDPLTQTILRPGESVPAAGVAARSLDGTQGSDAVAGDFLRDYLDRSRLPA